MGLLLGSFFEGARIKDIYRDLFDPKTMYSSRIIAISHSLPRLKHSPQIEERLCLTILKPRD
ncbi:MAG: hypothetical protein BGO25_14785 [Acidobacteriales bacterium 59-55]|nr:MAG: hypothetical protein BGO25_14785 [Acidobacteriales bacterium 59-55]